MKIIYRKPEPSIEVLQERFLQDPRVLQINAAKRQIVKTALPFLVLRGDKVKQVYHPNVQNRLDELDDMLNQILETDYKELCETPN